jgi:hypothetical protein
VQPVRDALDYYRRLNEAAKDERLHRKSVVEVGDSIGDGTGAPLVVKSASAYSVKSRRSLGTGSRSRSAEEDEDIAAPGVRMSIWFLCYCMNLAVCICLKGSRTVRYLSYHMKILAKIGTMSEICYQDLCFLHMPIYCLLYFVYCYFSPHIYRTQCLTVESIVATESTTYFGIK